MLCQLKLTDDVLLRQAMMDNIGVLVATVIMVIMALTTLGLKVTFHKCLLNRLIISTAEADVAIINGGNSHNKYFPIWFNVRLLIVWENLNHLIKLVTFILYYGVTFLHENGYAHSKNIFFVYMYWEYLLNILLFCKVNHFLLLCPFSICPF